MGNEEDQDLQNQLEKLKELVQSEEFIDNLKLEMRLWQLYSLFNKNRDEGIKIIKAELPALKEQILIKNNCRGGSLNMLRLLQENGYKDFVITTSNSGGHTYLQDLNGIIIDATIGQYTKEQEIFVGTVADLEVRRLGNHYKDGKPDTFLKNIYDNSFATTLTKTPSAHGLLPSYSSSKYTSPTKEPVKEPHKPSLTNLPKPG